MKIGIDCRTISEPAGVGTYTRELVRHLLEIDGHNQYALFFNDDFSGLPTGQAGTDEYKKQNTEIIFLPSRKLKKFLPIIYSHFLIARAIDQKKLDICVFPANVIPLGYRGPSVLVVHDLAVYKFPQLFPSKLINFDRRIVIPSSLRRAANIIAVSQSTKNDIAGLFKIPEEKIVVVYEGAAETK